jgi:transposase
MRPKGTAAELEARRRLAIRLLSDGKQISDVASTVGCTPLSVRRWRDAYQAGGDAALTAQPHLGPRPKLGDSQRQQLLKLLLAGPRAAGYRTQLWTCRRVAEVVQRHFGVSYHEDHLGRLMHGLGWTPQKPERRARERRESEIGRWRNQAWPQVKKEHPSAS